jgi:hypothetical protein
MGAQGVLLPLSDVTGPVPTATDEQGRLWIYRPVSSPHDKQGWWGTTGADGRGELGGAECVFSGAIDVMGGGDGLHAAASSNLAWTVSSAAQTPLTHCRWI